MRAFGCVKATQAEATQVRAGCAAPRDINRTSNALKINPKSTYLFTATSVTLTQRDRRLFSRGRAAALNTEARLL